MNLLNRLLEELDDQNDDNWLNALLHSLSDKINQTNDEELKFEASKALTIIENNKSKFTNLSKKAFVMFFAHLASSNINEATKEYLRSTATADEVIQSILDDAVDLENQYTELQELKKDASELAMALLKGAKFLLPLLLTVL